MNRNREIEQKNLGQSSVGKIELVQNASACNLKKLPKEMFEN